MCLSYFVNECLLSLIIKVLFIYFVWGIYMYMFMCMCTYVCRFTYIGVCSLEVNVGYFLQPCILRQILSLNLKLLNLVGQRAPGICPSPASLVLGFQMCVMEPSFYMVLEIQTQVFILAQRHFPNRIISLAIVIIDDKLLVVMGLQAIILEKVC